MNESAIDPSRYTLLVVDDEKNIRFSLSERFRPVYQAVHAVASGHEALALMDREPVDLVLLDQKLKESGEDGLEVLAEIKKRHPHAVVIIMTAFGRFEQAVEATRLGCYQYLSKPLDLDQLDLVIRSGLGTIELEREVTRLRFAQKQRYRVDLVMGDNAEMKRVVKLVEKVAASASSTVLICGETGVGKELVARMVHFHSSRSHGSFVEVNCSAIHENLLESELFGHERGAFTDARRAKPGLFEMADGGTLFLDEVGETSPTVQAKLLRVLETRRFRRLGGTEDRSVDVRVVAATNRDLQEMVRRNEFREDLYYRLSVIPIRIPPLRERPDDIPALITYFVDHFNSEFHLDVSGVSPEAMDVLTRHRWNGNVRELRNVIERIMLTIEGSEILASHLPPGFRTQSESVAASSGSDRDAGAASQGDGSGDALFAPGRVPTLAELEGWAIRRAMAVTGNNKTRAAELLGISRQTLRMKLKDADDSGEGDAGSPDARSRLSGELPAIQ